MTRRITVLAVSAVLTATLWTPAAFAGGDWIFGGAFEIGGVHFKIGFHGDRHDRYYYRTRVDVGRHYYGRAHRSRECYSDRGYYYHAQSCPLIHGYFRDHGYHADRVFARYSPRHRGYDRGYDRGHRYDRRGHRGDRYYGRGDRHHGRHYGKHHRHGGQYRGHSHYRDRGHRRHDDRHLRYCPYH